MHINEPDFWLAFESEDGAELVAVASTDLALSAPHDPDAAFLVGVVLGFHEAHPERRVIVMSDLTRWLASVALKWSDLDIDIHAALEVMVGRTNARLSRTTG